MKKTLTTKQPVRAAEERARKRELDVIRDQLSGVRESASRSELRNCVKEGVGPGPRP